MSKLMQRPSGLVVPAPSPEPPKPMLYFAVHKKNMGDLRLCLSGIHNTPGAELVSVSRHGEGRTILALGPGYVVVYAHNEALSFEEYT